MQFKKMLLNVLCALFVTNIALGSGVAIGTDTLTRVELDGKTALQLAHRGEEPAPGTFMATSLGWRRAGQQTRIPVTPASLRARDAAGKAYTLDPQTGEMILNTVRYYLPENWVFTAPAGAKADSYGRPIVNAQFGLPDWAQADVDALRAAVVQYVEMCRQFAAESRDLREVEGHLGNFIGQALVRGIAADDLINLNDRAVVSEHVARSILGYLHYYENLRYTHARETGATYERTSYGPAVAEFVAARGDTLDAVQALDAPVTGGRAAPSGCYYTSLEPLGLALLTDAQVIWNADGTDDSFVDADLGFPASDPFVFFGCQAPAANTAVRISSNGYVSFFQQGGGATHGDVYQNWPIPDTTVPDGFIAGWWDDLVIANQGVPDRVQYKVEGSVGNRYVTVEYYSVSRLGGTNTDAHTFQITLIENLHSAIGQNAIRLRYSADWAADSADDATVGVEDYDATDGDCPFGCAYLTAQPPNNVTLRASPNDLCVNARTVYDGYTYYEPLIPAYSDGSGCVPGNPDRWYRFTAPCNGTLIVSTCGTHDSPGVDLGMDSVLSVHSGCPGTGQNMLACNDDAAADYCLEQQGLRRDAYTWAFVPAGQTVYVRITYLGGQVGNGWFFLRVDFAGLEPPANDNCANAIPVIPNAEVTGNLLCATEDGIGGCNFLSSTRDVWYSVVAPLDGALRVTACGTHDSLGFDEGMDAVLTLHSGCPGTLDNQLACNDDPVGWLPCLGADDGILYDSIVQIGVAQGQEVYIRVTHFDQTVADGTFFAQIDFNRLGDTNCDSVVDFDDINPFVLALTGIEAHAAEFPDCIWLAADANQDGLVTFDDINPFVELLSG